MLATAEKWSNYTAFGSPMPGRNYQSSTPYRYGFNGKEKDAETYGDGNEYDFGARIYDPRIGRWLSTDPLQKKYPGVSPYVYTFNNPVIFNDPDGRDGRLTVVEEKDGSVSITLETVIHIYGKDATPATASALTKAYHDAGFDKTRTFKGKDGKIYNVTIKVTYSAENAEEIKKQQINVSGNSGGFDICTLDKLNKKNLTNFKEGDNIMEIDGEKNYGAAGYANVNGAVVGEGSTDKTKIHEPFHLLGFDEGYNVLTRRTNPGMENDVMKAGEGFIYAQADGKQWVSPDFGIEAIHYTNLIDFVIDNKKTGQSVISPVGNDMIEYTASGTKPYSMEQINKAKSAEITKKKGGK